MKYLKLKFLLIFAALAMAIPPAWAGTVIDEITLATTGVSGTSYAKFSGKKATSEAVYAGRCAGGNSAIQIKYESDASKVNGIVTTASGGTVKSVQIDFNSNTYDARTIRIFGKNSAYSYSDMADVSTRGTQIAAFTKSDGLSQSITLTTDYEYLCFTTLNNDGGAMYIDKITIVWETESASPAAKPSFSLEGGIYYGTQSVSISCATEGAIIHYTTDGSDPTATSAEYSAPITVDQSMTIKAIAVAEGYSNSAIAEATYTINPPLEPSGIIYKRVKTTTLVDGGTYIIVYEGDPATAMGELVTIPNNGTKGSPVTGILLNKDTEPYEVDLAGKSALFLTAHAIGNDGKYAFEIEEGSYLNCNSSSFSTVQNSTGINAQWVVLGDGRVKSANNDGRVIGYRKTNQLIGPYGATNYNGSTEYFYAYLYEKVESTPEPVDPELAFDEETVNTTFGADFTEPTLTKPEDLTVTYASNNTNVATVNQNTGAVTIVGVGTAKITASSEATNDYLAGEASYTIVVAQADATVTFYPKAYTKYVNDESFTGAVPSINPEGLEITYSIEGNDPEIVVFDEDDGTVMIGEKTGTVTITATVGGDGTNYKQASDSYTLTVEPRPYVTVIPNSLDFEAVIGQDPVSKTFTVMAENLKEGITLTMTESGVFTFTPPTIAMADMTEDGVEVTVTYNPTAATGEDFDEATITIESKDAEKVTVSLTGMATLPDPVLNVSTDELDMGTNPIGKFTVTGKNLTENVTLTITEGIAANFEITPATITPGEDGKVNQEVTVTYNGTSTTDESAIITVKSGKAEQPVMVTAKAETYVALAAPTFSPAAGTYTEPKEVAIACATPGVTIEYTIDGVTKTYEGPFLVDHSCTVTATATMGSKVIYNDSEASAQYTIKALPAAQIDNKYYYLVNNALPEMYANVAGRRTLNFVSDAAQQAGTVFRVETNNNGQVQTLRSQACDIQDYAKRAMNYVPTLVQVVINKLNDMTDVDDATGTGSILGENGLKALMDKFNECFDYNLYVEGGENAYRIYARTPSMQNVVDFYAEHKAQVDEKLPMLEGYINQVLAKIRSKVPANMNANVFEPFSLLTVWEEMGGTLIKPDSANVMKFYEQVLTNKEYVWNFAYTTAKHYLDNIKDTQTYRSLVAQHPDIDIYVGKMEEIRPETKFFIIQNGNEPDYVAETHSYIKQNLPMTYWTLTERKNFTVNVPEANKLNDSYYTTLYTDFGYTLPEGVEAYAVTGIDANDVAQLTKITDVIPAQTPVLLKATAAGDKELTLKMDSRGGAVEGNLLEGPDYLVKTYGIASPTVEMLFSMAEPFVPAETLAEYEYLKLRTSGTVNNKYFWNVNDALDSCTYKDANNEDDCVVRSLAVKNGTLAFSEHWTTENNKAFLVSDTKPVIYLEKETLAAPTFSPVPGSYTVNNGESVTITITAEDGATISYSTDGGKTWQTYNDNDPITASDDMTILAKAEKDGMIASNEVTAVYVIDNPTVLPDVPAMKGYYQIKNNGNNKYANVAGRKTLNFKSEDEAKTEAGTVIWLETNGKGQVQSIRSQAADLQRYADRAMSYVPEIVNIVVNKINEMNGIEDATGAGSVLGENGLGLIMEEFNKCFDHHLYVEEADGGYRLYGKTPNMQHVVDFYREHTAQVEEKLPKLEKFINDALTILKNKIGGSSVFTEFSLHEIWEKMGSTLLPEPIEGNDAAIMDFYRTVLNNKNYVWDFAYQTAMIYLNNIKGTQTYQNLVDEHPEILQYIDKIDQIRPDFKYYIVQKDGKPDFISEGNTDIINNVNRTIWTLEERKTFMVNNVGELFGCPLATNGVGGYFTTNYTDFAYNLPDSVTAYKVTGVDEDGEAILEALSGTIPAQTPVLLVAKEDKPYELTLTTDAGTAVSGNLLVGPDYLINEYDLKTAQVQGIFDLIKQKLGQDFYSTYVAQYEHLADLNSGTVNNKYFWSVNSFLDSCTYKNANNETDCVVRSLATDENGKLAFSEHWNTETNKAFLVSKTLDVITLPGTLRGDVNHDGLVNIKDVPDLIDRLLEPDADNLRACPYCSDVNEDNLVNIKDVTVLIDILLGVDGNATNP